MPEYSREWIEDVLVIREHVLLLFGRRDAQIARNWSKSTAVDEIFDDNTLTVV